MTAKDKAGFYHHLGQMLEGGLGVVSSLSQLAQHPPSASCAEPCRRLETVARQLGVLSESLDSEREWVEPFEVACVFAGENSGQVAAVLASLSKYWERVADARDKITRGILYPALLLELAVGVGGFVSGSGQSTSLLVAGLHLVVLNLLFALIWVAWSGPARDKVVGSVIRIPFCARVLTTPGLFRVVLALRLQIGAGVPLLTAVPTALQAGGGHLEQRTQEVCQSLRAGESLAVVLAPLFVAHPHLASAISAGELSGKITETFQFLERGLEADWEQQMALWTEWMPRMIYFAALFYAAIQAMTLLSGIGSNYDGLFSE